MAYALIAPDKSKTSNKKLISKKKAKAVQDVFGLMVFGVLGERGLLDIFTELSGKHNKTTQAWIKNGKFEEKFPAAVAKNPHMDEDNKTFLSGIFSENIDFESYAKISSEPYAFMLKTVLAFGKDGNSKEYELIIDRLAQDHPHIKRLSGPDKDHLECSLVFLSIINGYINQEIDVLEKINSLSKDESIYKNGEFDKEKFFQHTSSCFISTLSDIFVNRWDISKGKFYKLATANEDSDNARRAWHRWKKGSPKGTWFIYKKIYENLSKDSRFNEQDHVDAMLLAFKVNLIFLVKMIEDQGHNVPKGLVNMVFYISLIH